MLSRYDIVRAISEQTRSFATVGLLRQVKEATPIDMVCTYIIQTNQPWGLRDQVHDLNYSKKGRTWDTHISIRENTSADRMRSFPDGIVRMSKDYLIRTFWKQIDHLRSPSCMRVSPTGSFCNENCVSGLRPYPKAVLDALAACHIHHNARLWDAQHAIGALHAVCTPLMLDRPSWVKSNRYSFIVDQRQFDTLKGNHSRVIASLMSILDNYCWDTKNRNHIPNDAEKNILLDLIECFLVMFGPESFVNGFRNRQVYEYSRIGDVMASTPARYPREDCCCSSRNYVPDGTKVYSEWSYGVRQVVERMKNLSPEAAICVGEICDRYFDCVACTNPEVLKQITPMPLKEVELFITAEFNVQKQKEAAANKIMEAFKRGEFTASKCGQTYGKCSGDEPVPCDSCY